MGRSEEERKRQAAEASRRWRERNRERAKQVQRDAYHRRRAKDGLPTRRVFATEEERKEARREANRKWKAANPEKAKQASRDYYYEHIAKKRAASAEWQKANKERQRAMYLKRRYGLTPEQYDALGTCCAICGATKGNNRKNGDGGDYRLFVDHDHDTGKVRGLLCFACNVAIGYLEHDVTRLQQAIRYLQETA